MRNLSRLIVVALAAIVDLLIVVHNKAIDLRVAVLNAVIRDAQLKTVGALSQITEARKLADAIVADAVAHALLLRVPRSSTRPTATCATAHQPSDNTLPPSGSLTGICWGLFVIPERRQ